MHQARRYKRRLILVSAIRWEGNNMNAVCAFCPTIQVPYSSEDILWLGPHCLLRGDWIVRSAEGAFSPMSHRSFEALYELA